MRQGGIQLVTQLLDHLGTRGGGAIKLNWGEVDQLVEQVRFQQFGAPKRPPKRAPRGPQIAR